jgi:transposase
MLSLDQVGQRFGVSRQTALSWITRGLRGVRLTATAEPHPGPGGKRFLVAEADLAVFAVATGRQPKDIEVVAGETLQLELELAFERSGRIAAESQLLVLEERLAAREEELARLRADMYALQGALAQQLGAFSQVAARLGAAPTNAEGGTPRGAAF